MTFSNRIFSRSFLRTAIVLILASFTLSGCKVPWTRSIQYGHITQDTFRDSVPMTIKSNLIFIPVTIEGNTYRFLFDTGAPLSVSEELQNTLGAQQISTGTIVDSDHNRKAVSWVRMESLRIGDVSFIDQTAFVGDFQSNPMLRCLGIDGIIGGNLIRHCNWTIDREQNTLHFYSAKQGPDTGNAIGMPFTTDQQFNMFTSLRVGKATINHILVDYGSNGTVAVSEEIFNTLKERQIITNTYVEKGVSQSGIIGDAVPLNREITWSDSVRIGTQHLNDIGIRTGPTTSIGNGLLSRFLVHIDWQEQKLYFETRERIDTTPTPSGFRLGYSAEQGGYVQSVTEGSDAWNNGLRPMLKVVEINKHLLNTEADFCDYVNRQSLKGPVSLKWIDAEGAEQHAMITRGVPQ